MKILDGHIHIRNDCVEAEGLRERLHDAGIQGGLLISLRPACFLDAHETMTPDERLANVLAWCEGDARFYPFFWVDPLEADAERQVQAAAEAGAAGIKVICNRFHPGDERARPVFEAVARSGLPILFHSGILWDGQASSVYNRPAGFESLFGIGGLRFALAHISWPWCDEAIAVYGKFLNALGRQPPEDAVEMFIDTTPGTPPIYREGALQRLYTVGYDVERNVTFGTDGCAHDYNVAWAREWIERDLGILRGLPISETARADVFSGNLLRFLGVCKDTAPRRTVRPGA